MSADINTLIYNRLLWSQSPDEAAAANPELQHANQSIQNTVRSREILNQEILATVRGGNAPESCLPPTDESKRRRMLFTC